MADERLNVRAVNRLSKAILIGLGIFVVLIGGLLAAAKIYVRSDHARDQVEKALAKALKLPLKIGNASLQFPSRLRVESITTDTSSEAASGLDGQPNISAQAAQAQVRLGSLFSDDIQITNVSLENPKVVWPQTSRQRWAWPKPAKQTKEDKEPAEDKPGRKRRTKVDGIQLRQGEMEMLDAKGKPVFLASGIMADLTEVEKQSIAGTVTIAKLVYAEKFVFENVRTPFSYRAGVLVLEELNAAIFGGEAHGRFELDTKADAQPFKSRIDLRQMDLNAFATTSGWSDGEVAGKLNAKADMTGTIKEIARLEGPGEFSIEGGRFKKLQLFDAVAFVLDLGELANLQPREATAKFNLRDEKAFIDSLALATQNVRLTAKGVARFDGKLALDARLTVSDRAAQGLQKFARDTLTKFDDGTVGVDFKIGGKANKPKTDLAEKLIGGRVEDKVADLLGGLFGTKKKKDDEKKTDPEKNGNPGAEKPCE